MHSGDLDANGFRILHNLQKRVGRPVRPYLMAYDDAEKWYTYGKKMDDFNTKLLKKMYASDEYSPDEKKVFEYLMNKKVIIEQEKIVA